MKNFLLAVALFPIGTAVAADSFKPSQDAQFVKELKQGITKKCLIDMQEGVYQLEKEGKQITPAGMQRFCKCKGEKVVSHLKRDTISADADADAEDLLLALKSTHRKSEDECFAILNQKRRVKGTKK